MILDFPQATHVADSLSTSPVKPASAKFDFDNGPPKMPPANSTRNNSNASELYSITENEDNDTMNHVSQHYSNAKKRNSSSAKIVPLSDMISGREKQYWK